MPDAGNTAAPEPLPNYDVADPVAPGYVEAGLDPATLQPTPGESAMLSKRLRTGHIWAMGVGSVITGEYFGWNGGLGVAGPIGMLIASLFVCVLYMAWVLSLAELSVAMPFAGGPLAYGRRAVGPWLGFLMGWSMLLESLFATIGTAIATGGYIYFILNLLIKDSSKPWVTTVAALVTVLLFAILQWRGVQSQAKVMEWMTYGAIVALVWFWIACIPGIQVSRIFTNPILPFGWKGVLLAIPYAIWWLVIIESVALAAEEAHEPHKTIPRGLAYAQVTLIVLVVVTWFVVSSAAQDYRKIGESSLLFPLPAVYQEVWPGKGHMPHLLAFSVLAICGMVASYNGMIFAVSRQAFSLGRAGYLPSFLGYVHPVRRTPDLAIGVGTVVVGAFVMWNFFNENAVTIAVLTCNLTALVWYSLAIVCLFLLRKNEPGMSRPYKVPLYPILPAAVLVMSVASAVIYGWSQESTVLWLTAGMYAIGLAYYFGYARSRLTHSAPEEVAARRALEGLSADDTPVTPR
jgi:ethanolamine permease